MKCFGQIDLVKIKDIVLSKARFQKVVILIDSKSDLDFVGQIESKIKKDTVCFCVNFDLETETDIEKIIRDGTRCVISFLSDYNYFRLVQFYDFYAVTIDVFKDKMYAVRLKNYDDYYLFCDNKKLSVEDRLVIANYVIEWKWRNLIASKNYSNEEKLLLSIFDRVDLCKCGQFLNFDIYSELVRIESKYYKSYLFIRIMAIKYLFLTFLQSSQKMIDVYKTYYNDLEEVDYAYKLYKDERVNFLFKNCNKLMLDFINVLLANFSVNLNITKNEINNLLKNIKNKAKYNKKDNLLKYCYLYGIFENI